VVRQKLGVSSALHTAEHTSDCVDAATEGPFPSMGPGSRLNPCVQPAAPRTTGGGEAWRTSWRPERQALTPTTRRRRTGSWSCTRSPTAGAPQARGTRPWWCGWTKFGSLNLQPHPGRQWAPATQSRGDQRALAQSMETDGLPHCITGRNL